MSVKNIVMGLIESRGITKRRVETETNIANGAIGKWDEDTLPDSKTLISLANYFDVSIDYLLERGESKNLICLSENERELIEIYRAVSVEGKTAIITAARAFAGQVDYTKKEAASKMA